MFLTLISKDCVTSISFVLLFNQFHRHCFTSFGAIGFAKMPCTFTKPADSLWGAHGKSEIRAFEGHMANQRYEPLRGPWQIRDTSLWGAHGKSEIRAFEGPMANQRYEPLRGTWQIRDTSLWGAHGKSEIRAPDAIIITL